MAGRKEETLQRVTLKEMYDIFASDVYKEYREQRGLVVNNYGGMAFITHDDNVTQEEIDYYESEPLLLRHIAAEKCMRESYDTIPWDNYNVSNINDCLDLFYRWVHPLFWIDPTKMDDIVGEGRIAKEEYDRNRVSEVIDYCKYIEGYRLRKFAENPPLCSDDDIAEYGYRKGMHIWITLTCNFESLMCEVLDGTDLSLLNEKVIPYDAASLRKNLSYIAEMRGGQCAAKLLRTLRSEWNAIECWKPGFDKMNDKDIDYFKNILYNDYDDLLKEWEVMATKSEVAKKNALKKHRGRQKEALFLGEDGIKDEERTREEADRLIEYLKLHKMSNRQLDSSENNVLLKIIVSFYIQWAHKKMVPPCESANAAALYRFLTEDCHLETGVQKNGFTNNIRDMIRANKTDAYHHGEISELFSSVREKADSVN